MRNGPTILLLLWAVATLLVNVVSFLRSDLAGLGLMIAQVVLATAAVVLWERRLWVRLSALAVSLVAAAAWAASHSSLSSVQALLPFVGVMMASAMWAGGMRFLGWRFAPLGTTYTGQQRTRQFSLATLMMAMTVVAVCLGLARSVEFTGVYGVILVMVTLISVPGASLLTLTAPHGRGCFIGALVCSIAYLAVLMFPDTTFKEYVAEEALVVLTTELFCVSLSLVAFHFAGIRLTRPDATQQQGDHSALCRAAQPLP